MAGVQKAAASFLLFAVLDGFRIKSKPRDVPKTTTRYTVDPAEDQGSNEGLRNETERERNDAFPPPVVITPSTFPNCSLSQSDCKIEDMTGPTLVYPADSENTRCIDGGAFAFLVKPGRSDKLLFYFPNGGACWESPFTLPGGVPFCLPSMWLGLTVTGLGMGVTDFDRAGNSFSDFTFVAPAYCDGGAHVSNTTLNGKPQHGYNNSISTIEWTRNNLASTLDKFVIAGSSAGSLGTMAWADYLLSTFQYNKATVMVDSYLGVFPPETQGPTIQNFGMCSLPIFPNTPNFKAVCDAGTITIQDVFDSTIAAHPTVAFAVVQPKWDLVQRVFYAAIALSYLNLDLYMSSTGFYELTNEMLHRYGRHHNFVNYYVDGGFHTFLWFPGYYSATVKGVTGLLGDGDKPTLANWTNALIEHQPVQSQCNGPFERNGGDNWFFRNTQYCDEALYPKTLAVAPPASADRRMLGFQRIWTMAGFAGWHAANNFAGFDDDAARDIQVRDAEARLIEEDWQDSSLQNIVQSIKWMAQDYAWYAVNYMWYGLPDWLSSDYSKYLEHREDVKSALRGAGEPQDELFWAINRMVSEYAWVAAQTRYWERPEPRDKAHARKDSLQQQLDQIMASQAWPLFDP